MTANAENDEKLKQVGYGVILNACIYNFVMELYSSLLGSKVITTIIELFRVSYIITDHIYIIHPKVPTVVKHIQKTMHRLFKYTHFSVKDDFPPAVSSIELTQW